MRNLHGHARDGAMSPTYRTWTRIRARCSNPKTAGFAYYGGRGIRVCSRWDLFENFLADMGERPWPRASIERIDVDGDYTPSNCRWATPLEQGANKRNNAKLTFNGETLHIAEW